MLWLLTYQLDINPYLSQQFLNSRHDHESSPHNRGSLVYQEAHGHAETTQHKVSFPARYQVYL